MIKYCISNYFMISDVNTSLYPYLLLFPGLNWIFESHMMLSDFWTPLYIFCFSLCLIFLCQMEWKRQAFCSTDKSQTVALGATSCAMTALRSTILKAFFATNVMFKEKKALKAVQRVLFIKKFWSLIQLEMAILHSLTKTGRSQNKYSLCIWWLIPFKGPGNLWFSGECNVS